MFFLTGLFGNSSTVPHYELKVSKLVRTGRYAESLRVGALSPQTSKTLSSLRSYALCQMDSLGDALFSYPIDSGSQSLLPVLADSFRVNNSRRIYRSLGYVPNTERSFPVKKFLSIAHSRDTLSRANLSDYLLSAYLMDRDIEGFLNSLRTSYPDPDMSLPRHYQEALVLYANQCGDTLCPSVSTSIADDYQAFIRQKNDVSDGRSAAERCMASYAHTYWYYYFFE
jgi:hypothetical protein